MREHRRLLLPPPAADGPPDALELWLTWLAFLPSVAVVAALVIGGAG